MNYSHYIDLTKTVSRLGAVNVARYTLHRFRLRTGTYLKTTPPVDWADIPDTWLSGAHGCLPRPNEEALKTVVPDREKIFADADRIAHGELKYFSNHWKKRPGDWRSNPFNGVSTPLEHWSVFRDFDPEQGDIKWIWEPSRFDWVYTLGRAWLFSRDERYAEIFWNLLEDWAEHNPPNLGINWKCGQECSLRMLALIWAEPVFGAAGVSTSTRTRLLWRIVGALAGRIEPAIGYALSQFNNHSLSETLGLLAAGTCLPNHPRSLIWRSKGRKLFEQQVLKQFTPPGSYVQNSFNYERMALKLGICYVLICKNGTHPASDAVVERLSSAADFLRNMMDDSTGRLPNYGANDGANIMAMSGCDYRDFRPVLQLAAVVTGGRRLFERGPWDEEPAWLCGLDMYECPAESASGGSVREPIGGYYGMRQNRDMAFIRCHTHKTRPGHADMLHFDLWRKGINLLCDSGTYRYFDPQHGRDSYFPSTPAHNTLVVDGRDQMTRLRRFLWGSWTRSRILAYDSLETSRGETVTRFIGEHDGYVKHFGIRHRRTVIGYNDEWAVIDDAVFTRSGSHLLALIFHMDDGWECPSGDGPAYHPGAGMRLTTFAGDAERIFLSGEEHFPVTARSLYYGALEAGKVMKFQKRSDRSFRIVTLVTADRDITVEDGHVVWTDLRIPAKFSPVLWSVKQ